VAPEPDPLGPPTAETTLVVLLGASEYPRKQAWTNPVLGASARAFRDYVRSSAGLALPQGQILDLFDDEADQVSQLLRIEGFLATTGRAARDLVLYYVGHGGFDNDKYYLGIRSTQRDREFITTIESRKLAKIIREGFGRKRMYVILDSCFSGSAASDWQGDQIDVAVRKLAQPLPRHGTAFLAAASKHDVTRAPRTARYTMFTGALLEALQRGVDRPQARISLHELYEEVREVLRRRETDDEGRPEFHVPSQRDGDVSRLPMFPNPAYLRATETTRPRVEPAVRVEATEIVAPTVERQRTTAVQQIWSVLNRPVFGSAPGRSRSGTGKPNQILATLDRPVSALIAWACVGLLVPFVGLIVGWYAHHQLTRNRPSSAPAVRRLKAGRWLGVIGAIYTAWVLATLLGRH
jgi:hypothetical protein